MGSSRGHDSSESPDVLQENWIAAVPHTRSGTEAGRVAGYRHPRSATYDNSRSPMLHRVNQERFAEARRILAEEPDVDAVLHPLGPYLTLLRNLNAQKPYGKDGILGPDPLAQVKAAEMVLMLEGKHTAVEGRKGVQIGVQVGVNTQQTGVRVEATLGQMLEAFKNMTDAERLDYYQARKQAELTGQPPPPIPGLALTGPAQRDQDSDVVDGELIELIEH